MASGSSFDANLVLAHKFPEATYTYTERDVAIYALGVGACGRDAVDASELKYVYHENGQNFIQVLPTFAALFPNGLLEKGLNFPGLNLAGLHDKGKAAVMEIETKSYEKESGELLCMNRTTLFLRGAGGFSNPSCPYSYSNYPANEAGFVKIPRTQPFAVYEDSTQPSQALLYRLSGDYNPLHSDPMFAKVAGFSRPILHGLCTLGFAVRAIIKCICRGDVNNVKNISGRFLLHVYPGETLITEMWLEDLRIIYQVKVKERNRAVLSGYVDIRLTTSL